jgi:four helix bundle protein
MAFRFENLDIWKDSNKFVDKIYKVSKTFPREELFSLTDQLKRSASSVSANIAEGSGSSSKKDFSHYLDISIKSIFETISHLYLAKQQNYISDKIRQELYDEAEVLVKKIQSFKKWLNK